MPGHFTPQFEKHRPNWLALKKRSTGPIWLEVAADATPHTVNVSKQKFKRIGFKTMDIPMCAPCLRLCKIVRVFASIFRP